MQNTDQDNYDLEKIVDLFDRAISSNDPRVSKALRDLLLIVALTDSEDMNMSNPHRRPWRKMQDDLQTVTYRICDLERKVYELQKEHPHLLQETQGGG
jgi:hypothetical protein